MRYAGGLGNFEAQLGEHIMLFGATDRIRLKGKIDNRRCATVRKFLRFGFGRIQRKSYRQNWRLGDEKMSGANVKAFKQLPYDLQQQLIVILEESTRFTSLWHKDAFSDKSRNKHCAGYLNSKMGFPHSTSLFEFVDLFLSRNTTVRKHCDVKNCHRLGHNECSIYSYHVFLGSDQYKVSIIMTTRTTIGCAFARSGR